MSPRWQEVSRTGCLNEVDKNRSIRLQGECWLRGAHVHDNRWERMLASPQFSSVTQLCPTLCNPINRSTPGLPVHHQLPEFTHVHRIGDAIQPSHSLSSPSPPAFNLSPASGSFPINQLFPSGGQNIGASASILPMNNQD